MPPARHEAPARKAAAKPPVETITRDAPAVLPVTRDVVLPDDVMALAVAAAGDEPVAEWLARVIRAHKPDTTAAERQRRRRERARQALAAGGKS